jgi:hypothetical protein
MKHTKEQELFPFARASMHTPRERTNAVSVFFASLW